MRWVAGIVIAAALLAAGCEERAPETLRLGVAAAPVNLDPRYATDATGERIGRLLYRRLVAFDAHERPVPGLASWERLAPRRWRFALGAAGRRFHDGSRLTAHDVRATYRALLRADPPSPHRSALAHVTGIEVLDPDTLDFTLSRADPLFPGRLGIGIMPGDRLAAGHPFADHPIGSGPLRWVGRGADERIILERVADGARVEIVPVREAMVRALKLVRGELDVLQGDLPPETARWLAGRKGTRVLRAPGSTFSYLGFNMRDPITGRRAVRRAIALAIDRRIIIDHLLDGSARRAGALLSPEHWAGAPLAGVAHDPGRSRRVLERLGYGEGRRLRIDYATSNDPLRVRIATAIQAQLRRVGIEVRIRSHDWGTFYGDVKAGRFQMYGLSWVGLRLPDVFRYVFHSEAVPPQGANRGRYRSAAADRLIERAERTPLERRAGVYRALQALLLEDLPYVPLWYEDNVAAVRHNVIGYTLSAHGSYDGLITAKRAGP